MCCTEWDSRDTSKTTVRSSRSQKGRPYAPIASFLDAIYRPQSRGALNSSASSAESVAPISKLRIAKYELRVRPVSHLQPFGSRPPQHRFAPRARPSGGAKGHKNHICLVKRSSFWEPNTRVHRDCKHPNHQYSSFCWAIWRRSVQKGVSSLQPF